MEPFLQIVAKNLYANHGDAISELTLVFPNRRASLFFNHYLGQTINKPIWQPSVTTISELMYAFAGIKPADPLLLNYLLYKSYCEVTQSLEPYDDFYFWGNVMLSDFNQIDKYLVDAKKLFSNINDLKVIEQQFDEFGEENLNIIKRFLNIMNADAESQLRSRYSKIWSKLFDLYINFRCRLINQGIAYEGLAYRLAAERFGDDLPEVPRKTFVFIGFNALSTSEQKLFIYLKGLKKATFYWDYDEYYVSNNTGVEHEAGLFMKSNLTLFPNSLGKEHFNCFNKLENKNIKLYSLPSDIAQAKVIPEILAEISIEETKLNTAIVLPDENLLLPLLSAIPESMASVNITMEYPLRETSAYSLVDALLSLQTNKKQTGDKKFYYRDVLLILSHPFLLQVCGDMAYSIREEIVTTHQINVSMGDLQRNGLLAQIFKPVDNGAELTDYLSQCVGLIVNELDTDKADDQQKLEIEFLLTINQTLNRLKTVIAHIDEDYSVRIFRSYLTRALSEQRVSFLGEPLSGIQLMGFLETRNLDFENLVILSVNDHFLPGVGFNPSFIVPSLRQAYGLPDYRHQNAIYAYYFYRLMQRARNVFLLYADRAEGVSSGELSRFVQQIIMESSLEVKQISYTFDLGLTTEAPITIQKNSFVADKLNRYLAEAEGGRYLSPSALAEFKNCSLRFYFNRILGIAEPEEFEEQMDALGIGNVFHRAMEMIYSDFNGQIVTSELISAKLETNGLVEEIVFSAFKEILGYNGSLDALNGRNRLELERIGWMVCNALKTDLRRVPYQLVALEHEVVAEIPVETSDGKTTKVRLGGKIDRLEKKNNRFIIVDYKTGKHDNNKVSLDNLADLEKKEKDGIFQQLVYRYLYSLSNGSSTDNIDVQLWFVRNASEGYLPAITIPSTENFQSDFISNLKGLVSELLNTQSVFEQTSNTKLCKTCQYSSICNR